MASSTDLTIYEALEVLDSNGKASSTYKMVRSSLEAGLPPFLYCDHTHATEKEALACSYFSDKKFSLPKNKALELV